MHYHDGHTVIMASESTPLGCKEVAWTTYLVIWLSAVFGVLILGLLPILKAGLLDNSPVIPELGINRLIAAAVFGLIATVASERGGCPNTPPAIKRACVNAFFRGLGILAMLEKIIQTGGQP